MSHAYAFISLAVFTWAIGLIIGRAVHQEISGRAVILALVTRRLNTVTILLERDLAKYWRCKREFILFF